MLRKIFVLGVLLFSSINIVLAAAPEVNCVWLPGCEDSNMMVPSNANISENVWLELVTSIIWQVIQFVAVFAVITLILSGIMYLFSWWEEEKAKKAKTWIIWSLVWVIVSISAWWIIGILDKITIW